jgi:hypothetical protein
VKNYYVHVSDETGQQCLVADGEDGGAVLAGDPVQQLLQFPAVVAALDAALAAVDGLVDEYPSLDIDADPRVIELARARKALARARQVLPTDPASEEQPGIDLEAMNDAALEYLVLETGAAVTASITHGSRLAQYRWLRAQGVTDSHIASVLGLSAECRLRCSVCGDCVDVTEIREHLCTHQPNARGINWHDVRNAFTAVNDGG